MTRKKIFFRIFALLLAIAIASPMVAVLLIKLSPSLRQKILARVTRRIGQSAGMRIEARDFTVSPSRLGLELDGIIVRSGTQKSGPPLAQVEQVRAEFRVDSLLKQQWSLHSLEMDHPVIHVVIDPSGRNNLPEPTTVETVGTSRSIFNLAIKNCLVQHGEVYFNDRKSDLAAQLHDLQLSAQFDPVPQGYRGKLRYGQGSIEYAGYLPIDHATEADFTVTRTTLDLQKLAITSGRSNIVLRGNARDFTRPAIHGTYQAHVWTGDFAKALKSASLPEGVVELSGSLDYQDDASHSFLKNLVITGAMKSPSLQGTLQMHPLVVRGLTADYQISGGNLEVRNLRARVLDGTLNANLTVRDFAGMARSRMRAQLHNLSLEQLESTTQQYSLPESYLRGRLEAQAEATWGRTLADLAARAEFKLKGTLGESPSAPLNGALYISYSALRHEIELHQSYFRTPATSLTVEGKLSRYSQLQIAAHSTNLHELELLAANFAPRSAGGELRLYGAASFQGFLTGLITEPSLHGRLEATNLRVKRSSWKLLHANVDAAPSKINLTDGLLEDARLGTVKFNLRAGLASWVYSSASPMNIQVLLSHIALSDLQAIANRRYPVSGMLSGNVSLYGSQEHPVGHGELELTEARLLSEPVQKLSVQAQGNGDTVKAHLLLSLPAGAAHADLILNPKTHEYKTHIQAGGIRLEQLQAVRRRNLSIAGSLAMDANGSGTLSSPQLKAIVKTSSVRIQEQAIRGVTLSLGIHDRLADIELTSEFAQTPLTGHGTVKIDPPYAAELYLDSPRFSLQPLLALYALGIDAGIHGQAELHASLRGPLKNRKLLDGHLEIPVLTASYEQFQLGVSNPIRIDYRNGVLALQPATLQGTGTSLRVQGSIPVQDPQALRYLVQGTVDLGIVQLLQPGLRGSGQLQIDLDSSRRTPGSERIGELRVVNAALHGTAVPLGLDAGNGIVTVSRSRLEIQNFQGQVGGSTILARGGITLRPAIRFDLGLKGREIRLRYPEGVRSVLDSDLSFTGTREEATLAGTVIIQRISLSSDFDLGRFIDEFADEQGMVAPGGLAQRINLEVQVQSAAQVNAVSTKLSFRGSANLRLTGTAAEPVILGRADLNGGDLFLLGNRYTVQSGAVDFVNPLRTEPVVNAQVKTRVDQYDISLNIQGTIDRLKTTYTSEPPLPPVDIINLLAFGHTSQSTTGNPTAPANLGAQSALVQGLGSAVSSRVEKFAGVSYFSIDPSLGGSNQDAGARVVIQERVTSNLVVTYSTDVTSTQRQAIQLEYRFNPRWSVSGVRDQNGGFGATASYHRTF